MLDTDLFSQRHADGNRKRIYALASWTVVYRARGWYFRRTDSTGDWHGPYGSETSVCLMVAKELRKELLKRDGLPT